MKKTFLYAIVIFFITGCAGIQDVTIPEEYKHPLTGVVTVCNKPARATDYKIDVNAQAKVKAGLKGSFKNNKITFDSSGEIGGDVHAVKIEVQNIGKEDLNFISRLYNYCKANALGKMDDNAYIKKMDEIYQDVYKESVLPKISLLKRESNLTKVGCLNGKRYYENTIKDKLIFSEKRDTYHAQAWVNQEGSSHRVDIKYIVNGKTVAPVSYEKITLPFGSEKMLAVIPVNGNELEMVYKFTQQDIDPKDDAWGASVVTSLPLEKLEISVVLPEGKEISSLVRDHHLFSKNAFSKCNFESINNKALIKCPNVETSINEPATIIWDWNVWNNC